MKFIYVLFIAIVVYPVDCTPQTPPPVEPSTESKQAPAPKLAETSTRELTKEEVVALFKKHVDQQEYNQVMNDALARHQFSQDERDYFFKTYHPLNAKWAARAMGFSKTLSNFLKKNHRSQVLNRSTTASLLSLRFLIQYGPMVTYQSAETYAARHDFDLQEALAITIQEMEHYGIFQEFELIRQSLKIRARMESPKLLNPKALQIMDTVLKLLSQPLQGSVASFTQELNALETQLAQAMGG